MDTAFFNFVAHRILKKMRRLLVLGLICSCLMAYSQNDRINALADKFASELNPLYVDLHQNPELSFMEFKTAKKMAVLMRNLGFEVTEGVGGNGVVGVFMNGEGKTIMLRTDMDALPIEEKTGLTYASKIITKDVNGEEVPAMHACGHDMHMTVWYGTLKTLIELKDQWSGTILAIAQPAEEVSGGSIAMINDRLFKRFPVPDYALAYHVSASLPAGTIGYYPGPIFAGVNSIDIDIYGVGGHGALPHTTIDPVVIAAQTVLNLQTVVSREINPFNPAVVTVGSIHGGSKHNIIPDHVKLQLTVRFFTDEVFDQIKEALHRIPKGIALAAGVPEDKLPVVTISNEFTPPVSNNPDLVMKGVENMKDILGTERVNQVDPATVGEDFGKYGRTEENIPIALFWLGSVNHDKYKDHIENGTILPGLHNAKYAPDYYPTFKGGVSAMTKTVLDLFNN
ncbi:MAG: peptidase M20 [Bacteroidetes bacterium]|nr:peptidase M20 [Bacteroidota bacterium]